MYQVAIVGRPNVGKSTLFNRLCGSRRSIVGDEPGITRDRIYGVARRGEKAVSVLDTGGVIPDSQDVIPEEILRQAEAAIRESALVLLVVDGRAGVTPLDEQLLPMMRKTGKPVFTVVNKIDGPELEAYAAPFYAFGTAGVFPVSAEHSRGLGALLDAIMEALARRPRKLARGRGDADRGGGRAQRGKSSLVNRRSSSARS